MLYLDNVLSLKMESCQTATNPFDEEEEGAATDVKSKPEISYQDIATKLLNDNLLLTALELHTELVEAGKEIPKLRVFFSNPGNFEHNASTKPEILSPSIPRSLSQATLDSLDLTRYSEDGERGVDERVAVLEFELRKARETICALRANLTVATESETPTPEAGKLFGNDPAKPHEQRALNFLLHEYLLLHGYKLTSITFSDENENQDFEDWDDVGLNIPKPPELLQLYRDYMRQVGHSRPPGQDAACQTEAIECESVEVSTDIDVPDAIPPCTAIANQELLKHLESEVERLHERLKEVEHEKVEMRERLWSYERSSRNGELSEVPPREVSNQRTEDSFQREDEDGDGWTAVPPLGDMGQRRVGTEEDQISADIDWASLTMSTPDPLKAPGSRSGSGSASGSGGADTRGQVVEDDDHNSADTDWTPVIMTPTQTSSTPAGGSNSAILSTRNLDDLFGRPLSSLFRQEVLSKCMVDTSRVAESQQHVSEALRSVADLLPLESDTQALQLIHILTRALVRVIPNVILNKREEVIPLLVAAIKLHPEGKERDVLLNLLFNLKKRPEEEERRLILAGLVCAAQGMDTTLVENEVLPQCWEQINHRHCERRLLVAEACGVLAPYVSVAIRNSLVLSMLQQMLSEDREETVRIAVVHSAALIAALSPDCDKYAQCEDLVISCIADASVNVVRTVTQTLLPIVAQWALSTNRLQSQLFSRLVAQLRIQFKAKVVESPRSPTSSSASANTSTQRSLNVLMAISSVLPYVVLSVAEVDVVLARISPALPPPQPRAGFSELCRGLSSPTVFHSFDSSKASIGQIIAAFDMVMREQADPPPKWPNLCWISEEMVPELLEALSQIEVSQDELLTAFISLFRFVCAGFGPLVVSRQVKPVFASRLQDLEQALVEATGSAQRWPSLSVLAVYLAGVLATGQSEEEMEELRSTLRRFLLALPLCGASGFGGPPIDGLQAAVNALCKANKDIVHEAVLATLWEGVVSQRAPVRCATAALFTAAIGSVPEVLVATRVAPALVTLASDPDMSVRTSTVPAFGKLITSSTTKEVKEKVCLQLQSVLADPATRDSHLLLLQLIATLGQVVAACDAKFREDVVLPQLAAIAAFTSQLQNLTRKLDLAVALTEAFSAAVYCPLPSSVLTSAVLPGLRYLEQVQLQPVHRETILAMIREVESRSETQPIRREERSGSRSIAVVNVNQGVEDMRQRMSKIFQPKSGGAQPGLPTGLPSLFRKK